MLMEVPAYRVPGLKVVAFKTWWRLREFVLVAFPLLVVGSIVLSLVDFYGWQHGINAALAPMTSLLGLPRSVGLTLIFGVLRKELSLLMLMQALGTTHVLGAMTTAQIVIFTLFVTFYLPCMATLASMMREPRLAAHAGRLHGPAGAGRGHQPRRPRGVPAVLNGGFYGRLIGEGQDPPQALARLPHNSVTLTDPPPGRAPEPSGVLLLGTGLLGLVAFAWHRERRA